MLPTTQHNSRILGDSPHRRRYGKLAAGAQRRWTRHKWRRGATGEWIALQSHQHISRAMTMSVNVYLYLRVQSPASQNHEKFNFSSTAQCQASAWAGMQWYIHACTSAPAELHDESQASLGYVWDSVSKTTPLKRTKTQQHSSSYLTWECSSVAERFHT